MRDFNYAIRLQGVQDPLLPLDQNHESGNLLPSFAPHSGSPAIGSGMFILGLTDETPDTGAIDSDDEPWLIGIQ